MSHTPNNAGTSSKTNELVEIQTTSHLQIEKSIENRKEENKSMNFATLSNKLNNKWTRRLAMPVLVVALAVSFTTYEFAKPAGAQDRKSVV